MCSCVLLSQQYHIMCCVITLCWNHQIKSNLFAQNTSHLNAASGKSIINTSRNAWLREEYTHTHLTALFPGLPWWAGTRKVKPTWILLKHETVSGNGISWGHMLVCTLVQTDNHASSPPLSFYRPDALPATQPTASEHWRNVRRVIRINFSSNFRSPETSLHPSVMVTVLDMAMKGCLMWQHTHVCIAYFDARSHHVVTRDGC